MAEGPAPVEIARPGPGARAPWAGRAVTGALLVLATLAVLWPVVANGFVAFDDDAYVTANAHVLEGLTPDGLRWACSFRRTDFNHYWQPLTWVSLMLDRELHGLDPAGFHLTNLLLQRQGERR